MKLRVTPSRRRQTDHVVVGAAAAGTTAVRFRRTAPLLLPASSSTTGRHTGGGPGHSKTLYLVPSVLTSKDSRRASLSSSLASAKISQTGFRRYFKSPPAGCIFCLRHVIENVSSAEAVFLPPSVTILWRALRCGMIPSRMHRSVSLLCSGIPRCARHVNMLGMAFSRCVRSILGYQLITKRTIFFNQRI